MKTIIAASPFCGCCVTFQGAEIIRRNKDDGASGSNIHIIRRAREHAPVACRRSRWHNARSNPTAIRAQNDEEKATEIGIIPPSTLLKWILCFIFHALLEHSLILKRDTCINLIINLIYFFYHRCIFIKRCNPIPTAWPALSPPLSLLLSLFFSRPAPRTVQWQRNPASWFNTWTRVKIDFRKTSLNEAFHLDNFFLPFAAAWLW